MKKAKASSVARPRTKLPIGFILVCVLPTLLLTIIFIIIPTLQAFRLSFTNSTSMGGQFDNVGLENYKYMFQDRNFLQALNNTMRLMAVIPAISLLAALFLAAVITQGKLKEKAFYRTIFFFPSIISMTVVSIVWSFVFHPTMGILNSLLDAMGAHHLALAWTGDSRTALWTIGVALVWQSAGYYMVMHIAAMDGISPDIYEAATIDGASGIRQFFGITIPLIKDIIGITFVLALAGTINQSFVLAKVMTGGGPNGASTVLLQYMYNQGMKSGNFGYAMAITVFTLSISIVLSMLSRRLSGRNE